jgi:hypothetical protein
LDAETGGWGDWGVSFAGDAADAGTMLGVGMGIVTGASARALDERDIPPGLVPGLEVESETDELLRFIFVSALESPAV